MYSKIEKESLVNLDESEEINKLAQQYQLMDFVINTKD